MAGLDRGKRLNVLIVVESSGVYSTSFIGQLKVLYEVGLPRL